MCNQGQWEKMGQEELDRHNTGNCPCVGAGGQFRVVTHGNNLP